MSFGGGNCRQTCFISGNLKPARSGWNKMNKLRHVLCLFIEFRFCKIPMWCSSWRLFHLNLKLIKIMINLLNRLSFSLIISCFQLHVTCFWVANLIFIQIQCLMEVDDKIRNKSKFNRPLRIVVWENWLYQKVRTEHYTMTNLQSYRRKLQVRIIV